MPVRSIIVVLLDAWTIVVLWQDSLGPTHACPDIHRDPHVVRARPVGNGTLHQVMTVHVTKRRQD